MGTMQANIFNIQKFSIHDGPGIRTVVFFKGCPLRCKWCSNPESQSGDVQILWDQKKCVQCLGCVQRCKMGAVKRVDDRIRIDRSACIGCLACVDACPAEALSAEGKLYSLDEVLKIVMQDIDFYEESGGGVTLSGGEVLSQADFAQALLKELKERRIHTALETTGYATKDRFLSTIEDVDLLLFDMKHYDRMRHYEGTGVYNDCIIENMKAAAKLGREIIARIPVIPGFNDSLKDAEGFCKLLSQIGIQRVNLLPFHQFGQKKYELLGIPYAFEGVEQLHPEDLKEYKDCFRKAGLDASF